VGSLRFLAVLLTIVHSSAALALAANKAREIPPLPLPDTSQANFMAAPEPQSNARILELADAVLPAAVSTPAPLDNTTMPVGSKPTKGGGKAKMRPGPTKNGRYVPPAVH